MKAAKRSLPLSKSLAQQAYLQGNYSKAINLQMAIVSDMITSGEEPLTERKLFGLYLYSAGDYGAAIEILKLIEPLAAKGSEIPENIGIMMRQSGNLTASVQYLLKAHKMAPEKANICDGLAHCYGNLGKDKECQHFGRLSLRIKDAPQTKPWNDELTVDQIDQIQKVCGKMMKAIRYDLFDTTPVELDDEAEGVRDTKPASEHTNSKAAEVALPA